MNYYKILGLQKTASASDIKRAYHKLALQYHPDKPQGNAEMFKSISEAYDTLSNPEKRRMYDNPEHSFDLSDMMSPFSMRNPHDIFRNFFDGPAGQFVSISTTTVRHPDGRVETRTVQNVTPNFANFRFYF